MNVNNYFNDYTKCMIIFLVFIAVFVFAMFTEENFAHFENEVIFIGLSVILGLTGIYYSYKREMELHKVALILILVFGLLMVFFTPPLSFPDEAAHFSRAELMTEGYLYPEYSENGISINNYYFVFQDSYHGVTILSPENQYNNPINDNKGYCEWTTSSPFYSYLLSALGILIAKLLNLTAIWALYLSRIANLIFYGAVAYFMIKIIPKFKLPLLVIATMPLCISQVSSVSYDAFILTFTLVILTYFIKMYCGEVTSKNLAIFFISIILISLIKPPYIMLGFLLLVVPFEDEKLKKYTLIAMLALFVLILLNSSSFFTSLFTTTAVTSSNPSVPANVSSSGQISFILSNPLIILTLIKNTLFSVPSLFVLKSNFFHYTGYKGIKLINLLYVLFFIGFSLFYKLDVELEKKERLILAAIFLITYFGIYAIFYITWSPVGTALILGVQARYFIPVITLLPLIINLKNRKIENKEIYIFTFIIICLTGLFMLPITHFY